MVVIVCRLLVEVRLPEIKNIVPLQSMMRLVGKDAPLHLKRKLEVCVFALPFTCLCDLYLTLVFYGTSLTNPALFPQVLKNNSWWDVLCLSHRDSLNTTGRK